MSSTAFSPVRDRRRTDRRPTSSRRRRRARAQRAFASASSATATGARTSSEPARPRQLRARGGLRQEPGGAASARSRAYPGVQLTTDFADVLRSPDIDAVAVVTPVWTHFELAKAALENGKHVFVEKPFTSTSAAGRGAHRAGGAEEPQDHGGPHVPLQRRGAGRSASSSTAGTLGPLYYFDSTRVNLGLFQHDVSVVWDLAPHDLSIMDHIIAREARSGRRDRRQSPERPGRHGVHHHLLSPATSSRTSTSTGCRRSRCGPR